MIAFLRRWRRERRDRAILRRDGFNVYCDCGVTLNDERTGSDLLGCTEDADGVRLHTYICGVCCQESQWSFDLAPVPLRLRDGKVAGGERGAG